MSSLARIEELEKKFGESPRRFFAPLANEYRKAGDTARAIELCRIHLEQQPNHMSGQVVLGQALFDAGFKQEAREAFELALSLDPENLIALRHLGDMAREGGDFSAAKTWYMQVLDVDSRNHDVITLLREMDEMIDAGVFPTPERGEPVIQAGEEQGSHHSGELSDPVATADAVADATGAMESSPAATNGAAPDEEVAATQPEHASKFLVPASAPAPEPVAAASEPPPEMQAAAPWSQQEQTESAPVDTPAEEAVVDASADFWSAEEAVSETETVDAAASSHDPFTWLETEPAERAVEPVAYVEAVAVTSESVVEVASLEEETIAGTAAAPEEFSLQMESATESHTAAAAEVEEHPVQTQYFEAPLQSQLVDEPDFLAAPPEESSEMDEEAIRMESASDIDDVDDALQWELEALSSEINGAIKDNITAEWVAEFDIAADPGEIEFQREVSAGLDWPDSPVEDPAESGAADMSHMDVLDEAEEDGGPGAAAPTPAVFITETMAQLYEQQGYLEMSAAVYRQLSDRNPENGRFRERIEELDRRIAGRSEPPRERKIAAAEEGDSARDFFSSLVRVPLRPRLARPYVAARAEEQDADGPGASILDTGRPAREASNALSLESVFRNGGGGGRSGAGGSAGFSFDQFFVSGGQAPPSGGPAEREPRASRQRRGQDSEEIEQFNSWLEGLKRS